MKELTGKLSITRQRSNSIDRVAIKVVDETSHCQAVEIYVDLATFAEALLGMGYMPCQYEWNDSGAVGTKREHKTEIVTISGRSLDAARADAAISALEVDGWLGRRGDAANHHNVVDWGHDDTGVKVRVTFERWLDAEGKSAEFKE